MGHAKRTPPKIKYVVKLASSVIVICTQNASSTNQTELLGFQPCTNARILRDLVGDSPCHVECIVLLLINYPLPFK